MFQTITIKIIITIHEKYTGASTNRGTVVGKTSMTSVLPCFSKKEHGSGSLTCLRWWQWRQWPWITWGTYSKTETMFSHDDFFPLFWRGNLMLIYCDLWPKEFKIEKLLATLRYADLRILISTKQKQTYLS